MSKTKTISRLFKERVQILSSLKSSGVELYPNNFVSSLDLKEFKKKYDVLQIGECAQQEESLAGRILSRRKSKKFTTYNLHAGGETILIKEKIQAEAANRMTVMHGDIVGVKGFPRKEISGQLTIYSKSLEVLSPCLHQLPGVPKLVSEFSPGKRRDPQNYSLKPDVRACKRYLDLILNEDVRKIFEARSKIISYMRKFLDGQGFQEVETPILDSIPSFGAGVPLFTNYRNKKLYLRVTPELNLKKLLVGGLDRVYEIGKQFQNEGIDSTHNPEFTSCELYTTYADYKSMMKLTEELLSSLVNELTGSLVIKCQTTDLDKKPIDTDIDFTPPFRRIDLLEELKKVTGLSLNDLDSEKTNDDLKRECARHSIDCKPSHRTEGMLDKLVDHFLVPRCINPTFIIHHPRIMTMSAMAKSQKSNPEVTERFELYVNKQELCNAYSELNDPLEQRRRFAMLMKELEVVDHKTIILDEDFCESLELGLPPCAGWGIMVDRLIMLLTYSRTIKDVVLFPMRKSESKSKKPAEDPESEVKYDYTKLDPPVANGHSWSFKAPDARFCQSMMKPLASQHVRCKLDSRFIMDVSVMAGSTMAPLTPFTKIWRMCNNGTLPWNRGLQLLWIGGDRFSPSDSVEIQVPSTGVNVDHELDIAVDFIAPELPGRYISYWVMAELSGQKFGQSVLVQIQVDPSGDLTLESSPLLNSNLPSDSKETIFPQAC